jgi:hypothetical protein
MDGKQDPARGGNRGGAKTLQDKPQTSSSADDFQLNDDLAWLRAHPGERRFRGAFPGEFSGLPVPADHEVVVIVSLVGGHRVRGVAFVPRGRA